ncbi:MAG: XdhC family protein [Pyrinomonadaceae bacterium]|nr:XdhC family protein [Pyrinomonadaceae bacterium]
MNKDLEIWQFALAKLEKQDSVTLLVVAKSSGSSPGRQGFKMIVAEDELYGSIGGGIMEVALVQLAQGKRQKVKGKNKSEIIEQIHKKNVPNSSGMICSGKQTVVLKELTFSDLVTVSKIIEAIKNNQNVYLQITNNQFRISNSELSATNYKFQITDNEFIYQEKIGFKQNLYIIGGGHCALALSELMSKMDFHISLFDDRPHLNTLEKNQFAHSKNIIETYEKVADFVPSGNEVYVVVMTLGYKFDEIVIRQLFDKDFKYFGVLGSKAKMKTLLKTLESEGFDKTKLAKIRTPIGLPINSHTPEEIAVSIAAEIISVKNSVVN